MTDCVLQIHLMWIFEDSALNAVFRSMGIQASLWEGDNGVSTALGNTLNLTFLNRCSYLYFHKVFQNPKQLMVSVHAHSNIFYR